MIEPETTCDSLLGGQVSLKQPTRGYRVGIDSVLLAASVTAGNGNDVADLGVGVGAASLCLSQREPTVQITGFEISDSIARLASTNIATNGFDDRVRIEVVDVLDRRNLPDAGFDQLMSNPPFFLSGKGTESPYEGREQAARLGDGQIVTWVRSAAKMLRQGGYATFIYSVDRLELLLGAMAPRFGDLQIYPFWKQAGAPAKRAIVRGRKGHGGPTEFLPGMALHNSDGSFTDAADAVLRHGNAIRIGPDA